MGQKVNPIGIRLGISRDWASRWFPDRNNFAELVASDFEVREFLKKKLKDASVSRIHIERPARKAQITIHTARPGIVIGKKGEDIERLRMQVARMLELPLPDVRLNRLPLLLRQLIGADEIGQRPPIDQGSACEDRHLLAMAAIGPTVRDRVLRYPEVLSKSRLQPGAVECRQGCHTAGCQAGVDEGHQAGNVGRVEDHDHELRIRAVGLDVPAELGGDLGVALEQIFAGHPLFAGRTS